MPRRRFWKQTEPLRASSDVLTMGRSVSVAKSGRKAPSAASTGGAALLPRWRVSHIIILEFVA